SAFSPLSTTCRLMCSLDARSPSCVRITSPGSSSTSNTSTGFILYSRSHDGEMEGTALARHRLQPEAAAMVFDDALADGKADAAARIFEPVVQALEDDEDALEEARLDADAVVLNMHGGDAVLVPLGADADERRPTRLVILERIADQVLQQCAHLHGLAEHDRQRTALECCARLRYGLAEVLQQQRVGAFEVDRAQVALAPADARVVQEIVNQALHAVRAVDGEVEIGLAGLVHLVRIALGKQLHEAAHLAQGLLQIVGGDVGKLLELLVA